MWTFCTVCIAAGCWLGDAVVALDLVSLVDEIGVRPGGRSGGVVVPFVFAKLWTLDITGSWEMVSFTVEVAKNRIYL